MTSLSIVGSLAGLVPPITLGYLINDLVEKRGVKPEDALWAALLAGAVLVEAAAYVASDGLYARNAARLYRNLRMLMFAGVTRRPLAERLPREGLPSRFISDAETLERVTIYVLDTGSMLVVELGAALVALGVMEPWAVPVVAPLLALTWVATRRMQEPAARAGQECQEQLEELTATLTQELPHGGDPAGRARFEGAAERLLRDGPPLFPRAGSAGRSRTSQGGLPDRSRPAGAFCAKRTAVRGRRWKTVSGGRAEQRA